MSIIANEPVWRAELTFGTHLKPSDLALLIQTFQTEYRPWYATTAWARGITVGPTFEPQTISKVTLENSPLHHAGASEDDVTGYAVALAEFLAKRLEVRVTIDVYQILHAMIVERDESRR